MTLQSSIRITEVWALLSCKSIRVIGSKENLPHEAQNTDR
jgi:hypothetical protein